MKEKEDEYIKTRDEVSTIMRKQLKRKIRRLIISGRHESCVGWGGEV